MKLASPSTHPLAHARRLARSALSFLLLFTLSTAAHAQFKTVTSNGQIAIVGYTGPGGAVMIPSTIDNLPVTSIQYPAFVNALTVTSVMIPSGVTSIGPDSFLYCSNLASISIPDSVKSIDSLAFYGCSSLESVTIPTGVTAIENQTFYGCISLTSVTIPTGVTAIGNQAFYQCTSLAGVIIPAAVTSIGDQAFAGCSSLTEITIPQAVAAIGLQAFFQCTSVTSFTTDQNAAYTAVGGVLFDSGLTTLIQYPPASSAASYMIPDGVTAISKGAFAFCSNLTSVTLPDGFTTIGEQAFNSCTSLAGIDIPPTVTTIGDEAFAACSSLTGVVIPNGVTSLGEAAFDSCSSLTSVTIPNSVTSIGDDAFASCTSLKTVTIPSSVSSIGGAVFDSCSNLTNAIFNGNAPTMGASVFLMVDAGFKVSYYNGGTGFSSPTWTDTAGDKYPAVNLGSLPVASTLAAAAVNAVAATLRGEANPEATDAKVTFQYGPSIAYGQSSGMTDIGTGAVAVNCSQPITNLTPSTLYHYRIVATNAIGTDYGADKSFQTLAAPDIGSTPTVYLGASGAEVSQTVNPFGISTSLYFRYGLTTSFGSQTPPQNVGHGNQTVSLLTLFSGLAPNTPYYYQAVTVSAAGVFYGPVQIFTTLPFETSVAAQKGDPAPGVSGPTFAAFGNPAINANDAVAFKAGLAQGAGAGIWVDDSTGALQLIAHTGSSPAPGTTADFLTFNDPVYNSNEAVAFRAALKATANAAGIWTTGGPGNSLALLARQGGPAPGTNGTFASFASLGLADSGAAILFATLNNDAAAGITSSNNAGIWEGATAADLVLALRLGATVGGKTIAKLGFPPAASFASASGDLACGAAFTHNATGLVTVIGGTPQIAALSGSAAPGTTNATFAAFGPPAINNNDHLAFAATLTAGVGGVTAATDSGIWADESTGAPQLIVQTGSTPAPGTSTQFLTLGNPVYNNHEAVAFHATLKIAPGQAAPGAAAGIWATNGSPDSLALVALQGGQAPGCPTGATFKAFSAFALPDQGGANNQGGAILFATLTPDPVPGVTTANNTGIWAVDNTGALQLIARTGDTLNGKTITALAFLPSLPYVQGQTRSVSQATGDLVYLATFSDKSTGIFKVVFP